MKNIQAALQLCSQGRRLNLASACGGIILRALGAEIDLATLTEIEGYGMTLGKWLERHQLKLLINSEVQIGSLLQPNELRQFLTSPKLEGTKGKVLGVVAILAYNSDEYNQQNHAFLILSRHDLPRDLRMKLQDQDKWLIIDASCVRGYAVLATNDLRDELCLDVEKGFNVFLIPVTNSSA